MGKKHITLELFGDADYTKEEVYAFYKCWTDFSTIKSFTYVDKFNPNDAPNRRVKRIIEQENKKERNKERRKFDDKISDLIQYLKKIDPRYTRFQEEDRKIKQEK